MLNRSAPLDHVFRALSDPTRRAVLHQLSHGPATISTLAGPHDMALPSFLQHVKVLETSGLVVSRKEGRVRRCELRPAALSAAAAWISEQRAIWEGRLDRLDSYLHELQHREPIHAAKAMRRPPRRRS